MIQRCSWCQTVYGEKEPLDDNRETHGVCDECHARLMDFDKEQREKRKPLECDGSTRS